MDNQFVVFTLGEQRYALRLSAVERIVRAVQIDPLPQAPEIVLGIVNIQGRIVPIINLRRRFHLPEREIALSDQFVIAHTSRRPVGLVVDAVTDVIECPEQGVASGDSILPDMEYVAGVVKLQDGMVFIHDLDSCLSLEEEATLKLALEVM
ncbi:chemotaxis protein CheW [mine drainage metagenome]|uniref:Chemotaxis protein CheW n=1 Tax=mine drainage metagenome TaxID=410659 RepID=A0A1J5R5W7_9ZZZZ